MHALVFSRLHNCSSVWSNTSKKNIVKLQNVQNFATRIITDTRKYDHITPAIRQLNWLPVCYMLQLRGAVMTFKCLKGLAPPYLCDRFTMRSQVHNCNTRNTNMLQISRFSSTAGQRNYLYRAVDLWNKLRDNIKSIKSVNNFKLAFKYFLGEF